MTDDAASSALDHVVVAVDGPSGSGKSSVSRGVAARLGLRYLDTGSMYRALTWWLLAHGVDVHDREAVTVAVERPLIVPGTDPASPTIEVDGVDVAAPIRGPDVTAAVSAVSAVPAARERLARLQRQVIGAGGIVVEGRDIGTVVVPEAPVKVFLTADPAVRARRRTAELEHTDDVHATRADLERRDALDSGRDVSPLTRAEDAVEVDATHLSLAEVVQAVVALVLDRTGCEVA
ncbi:MAG: (d)CMP kinase [Actinomycetia bacterium]|jgi:cytidylate kinase|nr:(d)CMP kinase [Actinomycetes bacterium]